VLEQVREENRQLRAAYYAMKGAKEPHQPA
jgi:hypothetical protein